MNQENNNSVNVHKTIAVLADGLDHVKLLHELHRRRRRDGREGQRRCTTAVVFSSALKRKYCRFEGLPLPSQHVAFGMVWQAGERVSRAIEQVGFSEPACDWVLYNNKCGVEKQLRVWLYVLSKA